MITEDEEVHEVHRGQEVCGLPHGGFMAVDEVDTVGPRALLGDIGVDGGGHRQ